MKSKLLLLLTLFITFFESCKKETITAPAEVNKPAKLQLIDEVSAFLKSNYTASPLSDLSIDASVIHKLSKGKFIIRVPLTSDGGKSFILLSADSANGIQKSRLFHLEQTSNILKGERFNGSITLKELNGKLIEVREIINGFNVLKKTSNRSSNSTQRTSTGEWTVLPEVIVISHRYVFDNSTQFSAWVSLAELYNDPVYETQYIFDPIYSNISYTPDPNTIVVNPDILSTGSISLLNYLNCFNQISDLGATYSIKICAQLPVDNDPFPIFYGFRYRSYLFNGDQNKWKFQYNTKFWVLSCKWT